MNASMRPCSALRPATRTTCLLILATLFACGDSDGPDGPVFGSGQPDAGPRNDDDPNVGAERDGGDPPRTAPELDFEVAPIDGDYWEFEEITVWHGVAESIRYRFTLEDGRSASIDGLSYQVFNGRRQHLAGEDPRMVGWRMAFGNHRILRDANSLMPGEEATTPQDWLVVFDSWNGAWPSGAGFFGHGAYGEPLSPTPTTWNGRAALEVTQSGGNDCEYLPGYGQVCGESDPNQAYSVAEIYVDGVGAVFSEFVGCSSGGCIEITSHLLAWRIGGQSSCAGAGCAPDGEEPTGEQPTGEEPTEETPPTPEEPPTGCPQGTVFCDARGGAEAGCWDARVNCESVVACPDGDAACAAPGFAVDCSSDGCVAVNDSAESTDTACSNGIDDDGNGFTDCDDFTCLFNPNVAACLGENTDETCSNGIDDDGNGFADCSDLGCKASPAVTVCAGERLDSECSNELDDDGNGYADCDDWACSASPFVTTCP